MDRSRRTTILIAAAIALVVILSIGGVSLAVWIGDDGEGSSFEFTVEGWDDPSVRYLLFEATGEGGEALTLTYDDAAGCFAAADGSGAYYGGAVSEVTAVGYTGIIEELLIPAQIIVRSDDGQPYTDGVTASAANVVAVDMPDVEQPNGAALRLISELTVGANVAYVSAHSFSYCEYLTRVVFEPSSIAVTLGDYCFLRCPLLDEVVEDGRTVVRGEGCFG